MLIIILLKQGIKWYFEEETEVSHIVRIGNWLRVAKVSKNRNKSISILQQIVVIKIYIRSNINLKLTMFKYKGDY